MKVKQVFQDWRVFQGNSVVYPVGEKVARKQMVDCAGLAAVRAKTEGVEFSVLSEIVEGLDIAVQIVHPVDIMRVSRNVHLVHDAEILLRKFSILLPFFHIKFIGQILRFGTKLGLFKGLRNAFIIHCVKPSNLQEEFK